MVTDAEKVVGRLRRRSPEAARLATLLSPAARVERPLIRRVRLLVDGATAGTEAELWLSDLVQSRGTETITFRPAVADFLRGSFHGAGPERSRARALSLIQQMHAKAHWSLQTEERLIRLSMSGGPSSEAEVARVLAAAILRLKQAPDPIPIARWLLATLTRLPRSLQDSGLVHAAALAAGLHLDGRIAVTPPEMEGRHPHGADWMPWLFSGIKRIEVPVRLLEDSLELGAVGLGAKPIAVPRTNPLAVTVAWNRGGTRTEERVQFAENELRRVEIDATTVEITTLAGDHYTLHRPSPEEIKRKFCFVTMGFGTNTDFATGRTLDLDKTYRSVIKPAAEDAGFHCLRGDEMIVYPHRIRHLLEADVVIADISTLNPNALYELGVRHGLRPFTTIVIGEDQVSYPFGAADIIIRRYQHLGAGIDAEEAMRVRGELAAAIRTVESPNVDSPVYSLLAGLRPPVSRQPALGEDPGRTLSQLKVKERADIAMHAGDFASARQLLEVALQLTPSDSSVIQSLAMVMYNLGELDEARWHLQRLNADVSNDPETLDAWGAVHRRLWETTGERSQLDTAVLAYRRSFHLQAGFDSGINLAVALNLRAQLSPPADAIADFVIATRVRQQVIELCGSLLRAGLPTALDRYRVKATLAEAYLGVGDRAASALWLEQAAEEGPEEWTLERTHARLQTLEDVLVPSPLDLISGPR